MILAGKYVIPTDLAASEIGAAHLEKLRAVATYLYDDDSIQCRIAPSLVVRGEAELFGLSAPRFACRVYMTAGDGAFVNVRRFEVLARAVGQHLEERSLEDESRAPNDKFEAELFCLTDRMCSANSNCAADSLFTPPKKFTDAGYHILTAALGAAYGEDAKLHGTPYASHLEIFGGGMCAQAVAFQATALWPDCTMGIYGIAEITFLADQGEPEWTDLGGMTPDRLIRYFVSEHVGLNAQLQFVSGRLDPLKQVNLFSDVMYAYVVSGIPVLVPMDLGRMNGRELPGIPVRGQSILERNELPEQYRQGWQKPRPRPHVVLVSGVHKTESKREFLINDPATFPFLKASGPQLAEARWYTSGNKRRLDSLSIIAVTPSEIKLPLLNIRDGQIIRIGLLKIAEDIQQCGPPGLPRFKEPLYEPGEFRLIDLSFSQPNSERFEAAACGIPDDVINHLRELVDLGHVPKRWCWVQYKKHKHGEFGESLWIWDATREAPTPTDVFPEGQYLLAVAGRKGTQWTLSLPKSPPSSAVVPVPVSRASELNLPKGDSKLLKPALISSFDVDGLESAASQWKPGVGCEAYLAMRSDLQALFEENEPGQDAVSAMARLSEDESRINLIAHRLAAKNLPITGFASFIPEITGNPEERRGQRAQGAISFLAKLALALHKCGHDNAHLRTIELVAGSRIERIFQAEPLPIGDGLKFRHLARRMSDSEARRRVLANLSHAVKEPLSRQMQEHGICFAFELEPGPLFALRDWDTIRNFALMIDGNERLSPVVGLNLDIAHWRIALGDDAIEVIQKTEVVRRRIVHAHISGHHPHAHLGDVRLDVLNEPFRDFGPWIRLLRSIASEVWGRRYPSFSGYVSHEFEAARDPKEVWDSVEELRRLLTTA